MFEQSRGGHPQLKYVPSTGSEAHRRSIYVYCKRSQIYPPFAIFDGPNRETCTIRRGKSNTPLQSLVLLNESLFLDCARNLAWIAWQQKDMSVEDKLTLVFRRCTGRRPTAAEIAVLRELPERTISGLCREQRGRPHMDRPGGPVSRRGPGSAGHGWVDCRQSCSAQSG